MLFWALLMLSFSGHALEMNYGWSINADEQTAVREAVAAMKAKGLENPTFVLAFTTADYDHAVLTKELKAQIGEAKVCGMTGYQSVFTPDGFHRGEKGGIAILGFDMDDPVGVGIGELEVINLAGTAGVLATEKTKEIARSILLQAVENAGKALEDQPTMIYLAIPTGVEELCLEAVTDVFGPDIPLAGATTVTNDIGPGIVFLNEQVESPALLAVLFYTNTRIGNAFHSGFINKKDLYGTVTEAEGRLLKTIDGAPAMEKYASWAEDTFGPIESSQDFAAVQGQTAFAPLAHEVPTKHGKQYVSIVSTSMQEDGSVELLVNVKKGDRLYCVEGSREILINRSAEVVRRAMVKGRIKKSDLAGGLHIYCLGASLAVGEERLHEIVAAINSVMDGKPYIGILSGGEQGSFEGYGYFHGNLMSSMIVFEK